MWPFSVFHAGRERFLTPWPAAELPGQFYVWLASPEAEFLKGKFVWANWDAQELMERAEEIKSTKLLSVILAGADD
jgi:hypothetical protein